MQIFLGNSYPADCDMASFQNATQGDFLFDFKNIESICMHELLMTVAGIRLKGDFSTEVIALRSMGNRYRMGNWYRHPSSICL